MPQHSALTLNPTPTLTRCATRRRARSVTSIRARSGECARRRPCRSGSTVRPRLFGGSASWDRLPPAVCRLPPAACRLCACACACRLRLALILASSDLTLALTSPSPDRNPDQADWDVDHDDDESLPVDFHFYTTDALLHNAKLHINEDSPMAAARIPKDATIRDEL